MSVPFRENSIKTRTNHFVYMKWETMGIHETDLLVRVNGKKKFSDCFSLVNENIVKKKNVLKLRKQNIYSTRTLI